MYKKAYKNLTHLILYKSTKILEVSGEDVMECDLERGTKHLQPS